MLGLGIVWFKLDTLLYYANVSSSQLAVLRAVNGANVDNALQIAAIGFVVGGCVIFVTSIIGCVTVRTSSVSLYWGVS